MFQPSLSHICLPYPVQEKPLTSKTDIHIHSSKGTPPSSNLKRKFFLRASAFSILEIGFIILAYATLQSPVPLNLPSNITPTEAKGAFTVISILWHALAIFIVKDVLLHIFSAEWMEQYRMSGSLVAGETDVVSRVTTGLFDQLKHFTSKKSTLSFRLGFIGTILLIFLNALGPSAISINSIFLEHPLTTKVANLTLADSVFTNSTILLAIDRADAIVRIELLENTSYGFQSEENMLIPWPSLDPLSINGTFKYKSDVITYNFSCSWKQPLVAADAHSWAIDNRTWSLDIPKVLHPDFTIVDHALILPLREMESNVIPIHGTALSGFLFVGGNTTLPDVGLDLGDVPTNLIHLKQNFTLGETTDSPCLVSALVCDPQLHLAPATVTLSNGTLQAVTSPGPPLVKNILVEAANLIFSESLLISTSSSNFYDTKSVINIIVRRFFLTNTGITFGPMSDSTQPARPLPLDQINQNMNRLLLSSAKAYLSGYQPTGNYFVPSSYQTTDTNATVEVQRLALTGSRPFLIALLVVVCTSIVLLGFLVVEVRVDELRIFDLENIFRTLKIG